MDDKISPQKLPDGRVTIELRQSTQHGRTDRLPATVASGARRSDWRATRARGETEASGCRAARNGSDAEQWGARAVQAMIEYIG